MKCVILQPSYIPWRGYFHQIKTADVFVFYDCVQYDKGGWRNRNRIKTPRGSIWLTIPIFSKGIHRNKTPISQIKINSQTRWHENHFRNLNQMYRHAPFFDQYCQLLEELYCRDDFDLLADFTISSTIALAKSLHIDNTTFMRSTDFDIPAISKTDRILFILQEIGATHYISGPSAEDYLEKDKFKDLGVTIEFMDYAYPDYDQLYPPFDPFVSIFDLLFMTGPAAGSYIWG